MRLMRRSFEWSRRVSDRARDAIISRMLKLASLTASLYVPQAERCGVA